jgi:hypothetical protein
MAHPAKAPVVNQFAQAVINERIRSMKRISQAAVLAFAAGAAVVGAAGGAVANDGGHGGFDGLVAKAVSGAASTIAQAPITTLSNVCGTPVHGAPISSFFVEETTCVNKN